MCKVLVQVLELWKTLLYLERKQFIKSMVPHRFIITANLFFIKQMRLLLSLCGKNNHSAIKIFANQKALYMFSICIWILCLCIFYTCTIRFMSGPIVITLTIFRSSNAIAFQFSSAIASPMRWTSAWSSTRLVEFMKMISHIIVGYPSSIKLLLIQVA